LVSANGRDDLEKGGDDRPHTKRIKRVLVLDRDLMSSDILASAFERDRSFEAQAVQPRDLLRVLSIKPVDLVVIASGFDSNAGNGFDLARSIIRDYPKISIIVLLNSSHPEFVIRAFQSGARGVFSREQPMAEFLDCVATVAKGSIWAGRQQTDVLLEAIRGIPALNLAGVDDSPMLTERELNVVQCAAQGKTNKAIACELGLSEHTVKNYLFRAFEKLRVSSRVELFFYLTQRGYRFGTVKTVSSDGPIPAD
jgi:DNA-binding NarL/FixJ family response regulator